MVPPVVLCLMGLLATGRALRCYKCDNSVSRSCGEDFQAYQFEALECDQSLPHKCGKQIQEPIHDGWVGIIRGCYHLGSLPGVNETNGCHTWHHPHHNFTAVYCFCDLDFCNAATPAAPLLFPRLLWALALLTTFFLCASPYSSSSSSSSSSSFLSTTTTSTSTLPRSLSSSSSRLPASSPESPHDSQQSATGLREMMTVESRPAPHQTRLRKVEKQKERRGGEEEEEEEERTSPAPRMRSRRLRRIRNAFAGLPGKKKKKKGRRDATSVAESSSGRPLLHTGSRLGRTGSRLNRTGSRLSRTGSGLIQTGSRLEVDCQAGSVVMVGKEERKREREGGRGCSDMPAPRLFNGDREL
ncbi:uncharacterized protein LOC143286430 [Babylonia areolata]|uniref:uncharacterized protein LOC143286430 n=1 Tax=Babylonia areolata TaxID=304850 RepID=UPI003FD07246